MNNFGQVRLRATLLIVREMSYMLTLVDMVLVVTLLKGMKLSLMDQRLHLLLGGSLLTILSQKHS